uniref:Uncharacterized protein n=1 Tax=Mycena chlorophos TaxID=658473 RepID=A0ABQ0LBT3_MYCCL|nr:predicted protein [Mycena chlorophos]
MPVPVPRTLHAALGKPKLVLRALADRGFEDSQCHGVLVLSTACAIKRMLSTDCVACTHQRRPKTDHMRRSRRGRRQRRSRMRRAVVAKARDQEPVTQQPSSGSGLLTLQRYAPSPCAFRAAAYPLPRRCRLLQPTKKTRTRIYRRREGYHALVCLSRRTRCRRATCAPVAGLLGDAGLPPVLVLESKESTNTSRWSSPPFDIHLFTRNASVVAAPAPGLRRREDEHVTTIRARRRRRHSCSLSFLSALRECLFAGRTHTVPISRPTCGGIRMADDLPVASRMRPRRAKIFDHTLGSRSCMAQVGCLWSTDSKSQMRYSMRCLTRRCALGFGLRRFSGRRHVA